MQGKLDILAENVEEDGFVAGVCFLQDDSGKEPCFLQDDSAERRSGAGCLPRLMLSASLPEIACGGTPLRGVTAKPDRYPGKNVSYKRYST